MTESLLTLKQVAELLQVSMSTVWRATRSGALQTIKLSNVRHGPRCAVRVSREDLAAFVEARRAGA